MSSAAAALTNEEYEERRRFLEDLKALSKTEHTKIFDILKQHTAEYSQNSNGVFFDIAKLSQETFKALQNYMQFCRVVQKEQAERDMLEREAQNFLR